MSCFHKVMCINEAKPIMLIFCYCSIGKQRTKRDLKRVLSDYLRNKYCAPATFTGSNPTKLELFQFFRNFLEEYNLTL